MASLLRKWHSEILLLSRLHYPISLFVSFAPLVCAYSPFDRQAVWVPANLFDVFPAVWVDINNGSISIIDIVCINNGRGYSIPRLL